MADTRGPDPYTAYLQQKHRGFGTPAEAVAQAMLDGIGSAPLALERLALGEVNEVYDARTADGRAVIVRISHRGPQGFMAERWVLGRCAAAAIPVPRVLSLQTVPAGDREVTVCIEEKLPGRPLQLLINAGLETSAVQALVSDAGALLARINAITVDGWGPFDGEGRTSFASWRAYLLALLPEREQLLPSFARFGTGASVVEAAFAAAAVALPGVEPEQARLVHTDFGPKHLIVDGDRIAGVIDMENALGGDPQWDLAMWEYWFGEDLPLEWLLRGYGSAARGDAAAVQRRVVYRLILGLSAHGWYLEEGNQPGLELTARWLVRDVDALAI
jgi:Ser/Thr protein kinase RdoA (MazF antagonist)